ncbi:MAG: hypothetical protein Q9187_001938 [Circinaria calcarea]
MSSSGSFARRALPAFAVLTTAGFYLALKARTLQEKRRSTTASKPSSADEVSNTGGDSAGYAVSTHRSGQLAPSPTRERKKMEGRSKGEVDWVH